MLINQTWKMSAVDGSVFVNTGLPADLPARSDTAMSTHLLNYY